MSDIHTVVYSKKGVATAAFCCAFNELEPIDDEVRLIHYEDLLEHENKLKEFCSEVVRWFKAAN